MGRPEAPKASANRRTGGTGGGASAAARLPGPAAFWPAPLREGAPAADAGGGASNTGVASAPEGSCATTWDRSRGAAG
jgi:hypothetical protein